MPAGKSWCWQRRISLQADEQWIARLQEFGCSSWTLTQKPGQLSCVLAAHFETRQEATDLTAKWGGRTHSVKVEDWLKPARMKPLRIGSRLQILAAKPAPGKADKIASLVIPHGIAFGSGEHATTAMLLHALGRHQNLHRCCILDLGTGSGILALAARFFGARKIVATDFDADAVRTARENEALNFSVPLIRWRCADVKRLRARSRYYLVVANLFSGILCQAAGQISAAIIPGGDLWLSGILRSQQAEVVAAYEEQGLKLIRALRKGKWIALLWQKPSLIRKEQADSGKSSKRNKRARQSQ